MDTLRESIGLRAYGQRDPLIEYKAEAFKVFEELMVNIKTEICHNIFRSASSMMAFDNFIRNLPQRTIHQSADTFGGSAQRRSSGAPAQTPTAKSQRHGDGSHRSHGQSASPVRTRAEGGTQRSLPLRQREEIQALLREKRVDRGAFQPGRLG